MYKCWVAAMWLADQIFALTCRWKGVPNKVVYLGAKAVCSLLMDSVSIYSASVWERIFDYTKMSMCINNLSANSQLSIVVRSYTTCHSLYTTLYNHTYHMLKCQVISLAFWELQNTPRICAEQVITLESFLIFVIYYIINLFILYCSLLWKENLQINK